MFLFAYFLTFISGIIVLLMSPTDRRLKLHAFQAIILGGVIIIIAIISWIISWVMIGATVASYTALAASGAYTPGIYNAGAFAAAGLVSLFFGLVEFIIWLYGMYVGYQGMNGKDIVVPFVTNMAKGFAK